MFFTEGLSEPLGRWVKAFKPRSLQDAITRTRDMEHVVPKRKFPPKLSSLKKTKKRSPSRRSGPGKIGWMMMT